MRASLVLFFGGLLAGAGCLLPPLDLEGLACSEQQACSGTFVCVEGRCREPDSFTPRDAGADAGLVVPLDGGTCAAWLDAVFCADFDDFQQGPGWQLSADASVRMVPYLDPAAPTGSARVNVPGQGFAFVRSPSVPFARGSITPYVRASASFVLEAGAPPAALLALQLAPRHRLVLSYEGAGAGALVEERPDGGRNTTHQFAMPANGGSLWFEVVGDFSGDAGVWLGVSEGWTMTFPRPLIPIDATRTAAVADFGIVSAAAGGRVVLDFAALETW